MSFKIPSWLLWLALGASLFCNVVNVNLVLGVKDDAHSGDVKLCRGLGMTTAQSNRANGAIASVLNQSLANITTRANTKKELPSDKESARVYVKLISALRTSPSLDCSKLK